MTNATTPSKSKRLWSAALQILAIVLGGSGLSLQVLAQTPGATVTIPSSEQPVAGPGQGLNLDRDERTTWSRHPSATIGSTRGWRAILLADINGDGRDDLCGSYGLANGQRAYGCVLNGAATFTGNLRQAVAFNGAFDASIHSTIRVIDLHGNGQRHLCGRVMEGIKCQRFNGSGFDAPVLVHTMFSDANFWNQIPYASTIGFARLNNQLALCGRGVAGVMCFLKSGSEFSRFPIATASEYSDANGWAAVQHFSTLHYVDVSRDGQSDICGRGFSGLLCATWRVTPFNRFAPAQWVTTQFADSFGWNHPRYFPSLRFGDIDGDGLADVCGRGDAGLYCGITQAGWGSFGALVGVSNLAQPQMSDANNWGNPTSNLASLQLVDFDGDGKADACGLNTPHAGGDPEFFCAKSTSLPTGARFDPLVRRIKSIGLVGAVVSGRIYATSPATGFCWALQDNSVSCSVQWQP